VGGGGGGGPMFLLLAKFKFLKLEKSDFGGCQLPKVGKKKKRKKSPNSYTWFSLCSLRYRRMILLYF
jgi:hypothetical protein